MHDTAELETKVDTMRGWRERRRGRTDGGRRPRFPLPYLLFPAATVARLPFSSNQAVSLVSFDLMFAALAVAGIWYCVKVVRHPRLEPHARRPWRLLAGYFVLHLVGGMALGLGFGEDPATVGITPLLVIGVMCRVGQVVVLLRALPSFSTARLDRRGNQKLAMDVVTVLGGALMVVWYLLIGPALTGQRSSIGRGLAFHSVSSVLCDLAIIVGLSTILLRGVDPRVHRPLTLLLSGVGGYLFTDFWMIAVEVQGQTYSPSALVDLALLVPSFVLVAAAVERARLADVAGGPGAVTSRPRARKPSALPYLALAAGYCVLMTAAIRAGLYPWSGLVLGALIMTLGVALRQIIALRENYDLVVTDNLTGLANRVQLRSALKRAVDRSRRNNEPMAVLVIDLNGFKQINDTYGHDVGDALLVAFAEILRGNVRKGDTPIRHGGDEFVVVLDGVADGAQAVAIVERILAVSHRARPIAGELIQIRASVGIALNDLDEAGTRPDELLRRADLAMYAAKRRSTHGWCLYTDDLSGDGTPPEEQDLLQALEKGELRVHYQPIIALEHGELVAVEALVRWQHPSRGLLLPASFIPLAERCGLIHDVGMWVLAEAVRQVRSWQDRLPSGRSLSLSVNLSALQLRQPELAADILEVLDRHGFDPAHLVVEITESAMVQGLTARPQLDLLRERQVRVALDGFGSGYSSLQYLSQLPVDILKVDRCFVAELDGGPGRSAVAETVLRLARVLQLDTIVEGIEDAAQATEASLLGCRTAQGYHFARPLAAEGIDELVDLAGISWPRLPTIPVVAAAEDALGPLDPVLRSSDR